MTAVYKREPGTLLFGDIAVFLVSLWLTLAIRYRGWPNDLLLVNYLSAFIILFIVWALIFFIVGLYDQQIVFFREKLFGKLLGAHVANLLIALIFFYTLPYFGIAPKTTLFLYLLVSTAILALWRLVLYPKLSSGKIIKAIMIGDGKELQELIERFNKNHIFGLSFAPLVSPMHLNSTEAVARFKQRIIGEGVSVLAIDQNNPHIQPLFASLYELIFLGIQFLDTQEMYESAFGREPLGLLAESWFVEHISLAPTPLYDTLKRLMDIVIALPLALVSLLFYPFVWIAIKIDDKGPIFIFQDRIGKNNQIIRIVKFRTMNVVNSDQGLHEGQKRFTKNTEGDKRVTRVGAFLRKSRIDELPQLWNVLKGDVSLIGPRPELPDLVHFYNTEIPYYGVRHLIKPGLSGWAQIHHDVPPHSVEETKEKLSYDLFYIKHRSFFLDVKISLQTIKTLLSRTGI